MITNLPRRLTVEPILPGDFDDEFTNSVNSKRRRDDLRSALWTLRKPLASVLAVHFALIAFAVWLVS